MSMSQTPVQYDNKYKNVPIDQILKAKSVNTVNVGQDKIASYPELGIKSNNFVKMIKLIDSYKNKPQMQQYLLAIQQYQDSLGGAPGGVNPATMGAFSPFAMMDTQYLINPREIEHINKTVKKIQYATRIAPRILPTKRIARGNLEYKYHIDKDPYNPVFSLDFKEYAPGKVAHATETAYLVGIHMDYEFGMVEMDQSRLSNYFNSNIYERSISEFTALVSDFSERVIFRGLDIRTNNSEDVDIDANVLGILNSSNTDTPTITATATNDTLTTTGDGMAAILQLANILENTYLYPRPFDVVCTPGVLYQLMKNRNSYSDKTDLKNIYELGLDDKKRGGKPLIRGIWSTPHLINAAETNTTGALAMIAPRDQAGEPNVRIVESYPLWNYPMNLANLLGFNGKIAWFGAGVVERAHAIQFCDSLTIDTIS